MKSQKNRKLLKEAYGDESLKYLEKVKNKIQNGLLSYFSSAGMADDFLIENMKQVIRSDVERRIDELFFGPKMNTKFTELWGVYNSNEPFGLQDKLETFDWIEIAPYLQENSFYIGDNVSYDVANTFKIAKLFEGRDLGPEMIAGISEVYGDNIDSQMYGVMPMTRLHLGLEKKALGISLEDSLKLMEISLSPENLFGGKNGK